MNNQYEDKHIGSQMYNLENILEKKLFNTLRAHCKNDRGLILLLSKEAIDKVMQRTMASSREFIYKEMSPMEKNQVLDVPFPCSTGLHSILGPDTFSLLQQYCLWNEEIMIMVFNKAAALRDRIEQAPQGNRLTQGELDQQLDELLDEYEAILASQGRETY